MFSMAAVSSFSFSTTALEFSKIYAAAAILSADYPIIDTPQWLAELVVPQPVQVEQVECIGNLPIYDCI